MKIYRTYFVLSFLIILNSCLPSEDDLQQAESAETLQDIENLTIPEGFNFETERTVTLTITDQTPYVKYEVFGYIDQYGSVAENISEALNNLIYSGRPSDGEVNLVLSLSNIYTQVYVLRKDGLEYSSEVVNVVNNTIEFSITSANRIGSSSRTSANGCAECEDNFFLNGDFENGPALPNNYIITNEDNVEGWSTTAPNSKIELWKSGFNNVQANNGTYFAELNANQNAALYQRICTSPGAEINWSVWHRGRAGTDTAVVRIGENLATATTETTMTTDNTAWVEYSGTYTVPQGQEDTYFIFEAVSTAGSISVGNFIDNVVITEVSSGDCSGVSNKLFYPNELTNATLAFEDQWPYTGDYDFNDLVISYNIEAILKNKNKITQIDYNYTVESIGGSYINGFGIELEGVSPDLISSVTGANLTEGIIMNNANGTEQNQPNAVIVFFDNSHINVGLTNTVSIVFSNPVKTSVLGTAPFNPFLIIDRDRTKEIHLPTKPATFYPSTVSIVDSPTVKDSDGDFKTPIGLPWAINISGEFKAPKETITITEGYNFFADWATSGGASFSGWYRDNPGYRNNDKLKN